MAIWVIKDGQREGPYEEQDVRELIYEGTYTDVDLAIRDGQYHWSTLGEVLGKTRPAYESAVSDADLLQGEKSGELAMAPGNGASTVRRISSNAMGGAEPPEMPGGEPAAAPRTAQAAGVPAVISEAPPTQQAPTPVAIVDFQMPFTSMVIFMVKWALASIPALMIFGIITAMFWVGIVMVLDLIGRH